MGRLLTSFIEGYGSVVRFFIPPEQDDVENIRKDWIQVGKYLKHSIEEIEREVQKSVRKPAGEVGAGERRTK